MTIRFTDFELDESRRQLFRSGVEVHVQPKAWALLKLLLDRRPAAVSKQEIYDHLWPDTFVSDINVATLIAGLREALSDDAHQPKLIRTIHGFGYAFCGDAAEESAQSSAETIALLLIGSRAIPLRDGETVIGRDPALDAAIDDATVSRRHAILTCSASTATLRDCDSKNGTFLASRRIDAPAELRDGDVVTFGTVKAVFSRKTTSDSTQTVASQPARTHDQ